MKRIKALIIALIVFILMFSVVDIFIKAPTIQNLNNGKVQIIGHAGSGFEYLINPWNPFPSNSQASIIKAIENGADGLELDIQASKDSVIMLFHDLELQSKTKLDGCICEYDQVELEKTTYELGFPYDWFQNEKLISFSNISNQLEEYKIYFDIKMSNKCLLNNKEQFELIQIALEKIYAKQLLDITIISANDNYLIELQKQFPKWNYSLECKDNFEQAIATAKLNHFTSLCIGSKNATKELSAKIHGSGLQVVLYGGKSKLGLRKILELNPDVVQVNNIKAMQSLLH